MARRTNYAYERNARAKTKAAKREAKRQAKLAAKAEKAGGVSDEALDNVIVEGQEPAEDQDGVTEDSMPPENA